MSYTTFKSACHPCQPARFVVLNVYKGQQPPRRRGFRKSDVAQDGCTVICRAKDCYQIGHHRCAACELESYCSETCRRKDRNRHAKDCIPSASTLERMKKFNRQAPCCGVAKCRHPVVSLCRHCEATVCSNWKCSKAHLDRCSTYWEASLQREWVLIECANMNKGNDDDGERGESKKDMGEDG